MRLDLRYLIDDVDEYPEFETSCALYWFQRACEERLRLVPDDEDARDDLQAVRTLRRARGFPDAISQPRFGPIAQTYLDRVPYLARIVGDISTTYDKENERESIAATCERYGCLSTDVEFYVSAIGSYQIRPILAGMKVTYDEAHREVFAALDYLAAQGRRVS